MCTHVRSTAVIGVSALWIYSILVASIPLLRCLINPQCAPLEQEPDEFHRIYVVYLAVQFISAAVASVLLTVSVVDRLLRRGRHASSNSFDVTRRFQTVSAVTADQPRRTLVAVTVCAACWTPCVAFQLVDHLGCKLPNDDLGPKVIIYIIIRQVSPLIGLSAGLLLPLVYFCRCPLRPGCSNITTRNRPTN